MILRQSLTTLTLFFSAPFTFDAAGFIALVAQLRATPVSSSDGSSVALRAPSFDHALQDPVPDDIEIPLSCKLVIIEGNYVLLDAEPWGVLSQLVDESYDHTLRP